MSLNSLRVLVIGCGSIGKRHLRNLLTMEDVSASAYDAQPDRRHETAREFKVPVFETLEQAWSSKPNIALIAVPTHLHIPLAQLAAENGCHLFIEKPLGDRWEGIEKLLKTIEERSLHSLVGCNLRFHPGLRQVKKWLDEKTIGQVTGGRFEVGQYLPDWHPGEDYRKGYSAQSELGGGIILDAIHELDYAQWLLGEAEQIVCFAGTLSRLAIDTEDTAAIIMRCAGGRIAEIHLDYVQRVYSRTCQIIGDEGTLRWDYLSGDAQLYKASTARWQTVSLPSGWEPNQMYLDELRHFVKCVRRGQTTEVSAAQGAEVLQLALSAKKSAESNQIIPRRADPVSR